MSIIPYRDSRERKRTLDQGQIVRAALELLDDAGMDELTMRRLAERLGVKAASLYRHVKDKNELLVLVADEISGEIPPPRAGGTWQDRVRNMARNVRRGLLAHRDAARVLAATPPFGPRRLRHIEALLRILRSAGLSARDAARVGYHCNNFVTEFVADEMRMAAFLERPGASRKAMFAEIRKHFRSLPVEEYPTLVELADELGEDDPDGLFEFGLEVWLAGVERVAKKRGSSRR